MGWSNDESQITKKGMDTSTKILLAIIACVVIIILIIFMLLINIEQNNFTISVDGKSTTTVSKEKLITNIDSTTYINIEEFAKLVGYEYHKGEYKSFTLEEGKCYVQGIKETTTFYANDNKICKLPLNKLQEEYREHTVENTIKINNNKMYAPIDAIGVAFNVNIEVSENSLTVYTLDYLVKYYNNKLLQWGYKDITNQSFENKKALLYGYLIVNKENGLYKIIDNKNTKEIVPDKYTSIEFSESTQEFLVTNSLGQVGIINLDGTTKIEPIYNSISILDKQSDLYLIQKNNKFGVIKSGNVIVITPEYDTIGLNNLNSTSIAYNKYFILDTLIPVCQNNKWGAFDKKGNLVLNLEYDGFGCMDTTVLINETTKTVQPVITIPKCNGIVVEKEEKYGVLDLTGKELVPIQVESIYSIENIQDENERYFMLYNGEELNIIERLIIAGIIESEKKADEDDKNDLGNTIENNVITVPISSDINDQINNTSNEITSNFVNQAE